MALTGRRRRTCWHGLLGINPQNIRSWRYYGWMSLAICTIVFLLLEMPSPQQPPGVSIKHPGMELSHRHLLSTENTSSVHAVAWETCDFENDNIPGLWLFIHIVIIIIICIAIAIICDDFFVPSLEAISEKLNLSEDVAGATFMAAGSSAPELFTSVAGVAVETDVGVGTIVGSAVFNILIIIALTAALAGQVLHLDWRPLIRDAFFYAMSITCFLAFAWDGYVRYYEAIIMLLLYVSYIVLMVFNPKLMDWMANWTCLCCKKTAVLPADEELGDSPEPTTQHTQVNHSNPKLRDHSAPRPSLTGGHARRLSLISQRSISDSYDKHIYHGHQRGSIVGALMNAPSRISYKDSGIHSQDNSVFFPSTDTSHVDVNGEEQYGQSLKPSDATLRRNGSLGQRGSVSGGEEFEMKRRESDPSKKHASLPPINGAQNGNVPSAQGTLPSVPAESQETDVQNNKKNFGTIFDYANEPVSNGKVNSPGSSVNTETSNSPLFNNAHIEFSASDIQNTNSRLPEAIKEENEKSDSASQQEDDEDVGYQVCPCLPCCPVVRAEAPERTEDGCLNWMKFILKWCLFIPAFPFYCLYSWTVPDCSKEHNRKWFLVSFCMSVVWIAVLSFALVTSVSRAGCILNIDSYTMGLVIIAIGTSIPDALSSVLVARDGYGDMAVSNAIGSNVFDINLGLGLPFIIRIAIDAGSPINLLEDEERIDYENGDILLIPHAKFGFILLLILFLTLIVFSVARFRLTRMIGFSFVFMYVCFLCYAFLQELYCIRHLNSYC